MKSAGWKSFLAILGLCSLAAFILSLKSYWPGGLGSFGVDFLPKFSAVGLGAFLAFYLEHKRQAAEEEINDLERQYSLAGLLEDIKNNIHSNISQSAAAIETYDSDFLWQTLEPEWHSEIQDILEGNNYEDSYPGIDASFWPEVRDLFLKWENRPHVLRDLSAFYTRVDSAAKNLPVEDPEPLRPPLQDHGYGNLDDSDLKSLDRILIRHAAVIIKYGVEIQDEWGRYDLDPSDISLSARIFARLAGRPLPGDADFEPERSPQFGSH